MPLMSKTGKLSNFHKFSVNSIGSPGSNKQWKGAEELALFDSWISTVPLVFIKTKIRSTPKASFLCFNAVQLGSTKSEKVSISKRVRWVLKGRNSNPSKALSNANPTSIGKPFWGSFKRFASKKVLSMELFEKSASKGISTL